MNLPGGDDSGGGRRRLKDDIPAPFRRLLGPPDEEERWHEPVPMSDRVRLAVKVASVIPAYLWLREVDHAWDHPAAAVAVPIGFVMIVVGVVDLLAARHGELQPVFLQDRRQQMRAQAGLAALGVILFFVGILRFVSGTG